LTYSPKKKDLITKYKNYAFNMGCVTYFYTIEHPSKDFTHSKQRSILSE